MWTNSLFDPGLTRPLSNDVRNTTGVQARAQPGAVINGSRDRREHPILRSAAADGEPRLKRGLRLAVDGDDLFPATFPQHAELPGAIGAAGEPFDLDPAQTKQGKEAQESGISDTPGGTVGVADCEQLDYLERESCAPGGPGRTFRQLGCRSRCNSARSSADNS